MKKMLVASAALALVGMAAQAAEVTSSNIVGYQKLDLAGRSAMISATFATIGAQTWRLGDVVADGMDPFGDIVQVLSLENAETVSQYTYIDLATATDVFEDPSLAGWWDYTLIGEEGGRADDVIIAAGQGLLCNISTAGVKFTYSGELLQGSTEVPLLGRSAILSNFLPVDITLGDVEAVGMDPFGDIIQELSLENAETVAQYTYIDLATATDVFEDPSLAGWWDYSLIGEEGGRADGVIFKAGTGLLCNIATSGVSFVFPDPMAP